MRPCHPGVRCINLHPGYRCDRCPTGYTGPMTEGVGIEMARSHRQICQDINECETNNGGCDPYSECINTEVRNLNEELFFNMHSSKVDLRDLFRCVIQRRSSFLKGSYRCGPCRSGYVGNQTTGCYLQHDVCPDMVTVCDANANCISMYTNEYVCKVSVPVVYYSIKILNKEKQNFSSLKISHLGILNYK